MKKKSFLWSLLAMFLMATISVGFTACGDDNNDEPDYGNTENGKSTISETDFKEHHKTWDDICQYINDNGLKNIDETKNYLENHISGIASVKQHNNSLFVYTNSGLKIEIGFTNYPLLNTSDFNSEEVENSIDNLFEKENIISNVEQAHATSTEFKSELYRPYSNNGIYTTRSSNDKVRLSRKNVAVWCPWRKFFDFKTDEEYINKCIKMNNPHSNVWVFNNFGPNSFASWADFDIVVISAHGQEDGCLIIPYNCLNVEDIDVYNKELESDRVWYGIYNYFISEKKVAPVKCFVLGKEFYEKYLPKLSNTIVYTITCFAGKENGELLTTILNKDVADYFGSDIECSPDTILKEFSSFYNKFSLGISSNKAFANGKGFFKEKVNVLDTIIIFSEDTVYFFKELEYTYRRFGNKSVSYTIPYSLGVIKRFLDKTTRASSDHIVVRSQLRFDKTFKNSTSNLESGICLKDKNLNSIEFLPFDNLEKEIDEIHDYAETSIRNIESKLSGLNKNHEYIYCTYVKNGNQITLSEECFEILPSENYQLNLNYQVSSEIKEKTWPSGEWKKSTYTHERWIYIYKINDEFYMPRYDMFDLWGSARECKAKFENDEVVCDNQYHVIYGHYDDGDKFILGKYKCSLEEDNIILRVESNLESNYNLYEEFILKKLDSDPMLTYNGYYNSISYNGYNIEYENYTKNSVGSLLNYERFKSTNIQDEIVHFVKTPHNQ